MTLKEALCGDVVIIRSFLAEDDILKKISAMGLRKGSQFEVARRCGRNLLLRNNATCLIISDEIAEKIEVELKGRPEAPCEDVTCTIESPPCQTVEGPLQKGANRRWKWLEKLCPLFRRK